jgi:hypothetical protein
MMNRPEKIMEKKLVKSNQSNKKSFTHVKPSDPLRHPEEVTGRAGRVGNAGMLGKGWGAR